MYRQRVEPRPHHEPEDLGSATHAPLCSVWLVDATRLRRRNTARRVSASWAPCMMRLSAKPMSALACALGNHITVRDCDGGKGVSFLCNRQHV